MENKTVFFPMSYAKFSLFWGMVQTEFLDKEGNETENRTWNLFQMVVMQGLGLSECSDEDIDKARTVMISLPEISIPLIWHMGNETISKLEKEKPGILSAAKFVLSDFFEPILKAMNKAKEQKKTPKGFEPHNRLSSYFSEGDLN